MTNGKNSAKPIDGNRDNNILLRKLFIFELLKAGFTGPQVRKVVGPVDNNLLSSLSAGFKNKSKNE